jgi:hypothetical protein
LDIVTFYRQLKRSRDSTTIVATNGDWTLISPDGTITLYNS